MHMYRIFVGNKFHTASLLFASADEGSALSAVENLLQSEEVREMERKEIEWSKEVESKEIVSENDHRYATFGHPLEKCHNADTQDKKFSSFFTKNIYDFVAVIVEAGWSNG